MEDKAFSSIDFVGQCMVDVSRTELFHKAISRVVKKGSLVLDVGTGSGILSLFAARAGARKVMAIEFDPYIAELAQKSFIRNGYEDVINIILEDARHFKSPRKNHFDVVIMEMLTTGVVDEYQIQAVNNLHKSKAVNKLTKFIPYRHDTFIALANMDFNYYGFTMEFILHLWSWHKWKSQGLLLYSKKETLNSLTFNKVINETQDIKVSFKVLRSGQINSLYLSSKSFLYQGVMIDDTESLNAPMIIPIDTFDVKKGEIVKFRIRYKFGNGYKNFIAEHIK